MRGLRRVVVDGGAVGRGSILVDGTGSGMGVTGAYERESGREGRRRMILGCFGRRLRGKGFGRARGGLSEVMSLSLWSRHVVDIDCILMACRRTAGHSAWRRASIIVQEPCCMDARRRA